MRDSDGKIMKDSEGRRINMLRDEAGIPAQTLSSFVNQHLRGALAGKGEAFNSSKAALKDTVLVLDEASLVANKQMTDLVKIANNLNLDRLVIIGDKAQLQPIDAGKAFALVQSHEPDMAIMRVSQRQRTEAPENWEEAGETALFYPEDRRHQ